MPWAEIRWDICGRTDADAVGGDLSNHCRSSDGLEGAGGKYRAYFLEEVMCDAYLRSCWCEYGVSVSEGRLKPNGCDVGDDEMEHPLPLSIAGMRL